MDVSDLAEWSLGQLADEIATLGSHIHAVTCRRLEPVGEIDRRGSRADRVAARARSGRRGGARCCRARHASTCGWRLVDGGCGIDQADRLRETATEPIDRTTSAGGDGEPLDLELAVGAPIRATLHRRDRGP